jgi:lipopolysaccharide transport system ATP-binding protein
MPDVTIRVESISKRYRIGLKEQLPDTLGGSLLSWAKSPLSNYRRLRKLSSFSEDEDSDDLIWALKDVSFDVKHGEVLGIIGPNGAGKSTLLKILASITEPTKGKAWINGRVASLLEVGTGFHPDLTGRENVYLNGTVLGMSKKEIDSKFDEIVAFAEVEKFIDTPVKRYSSGMQVRLAFAVAAHLEPEILVIDEVLAVGDTQFQNKCLDKMRDISESGRTILFVSHNMGAIDSFCHRVILLKKGEIVHSGLPQDVIQAYLIDSSLSNNESERTGYFLNQSLIDAEAEQDFRIDDIQISNPDNSAFGPRVGDPFEVSIFYRSSRIYNYPRILISFHSLVGNKVIDLESYPVSGYEIEQLFSSGMIILRIADLPLVPGRYLMDVAFIRSNSDWIAKYKAIVEFDVAYKDVYGSGYPPKGLVKVDHCWDHMRQLKPNNE